MEVVFSDGTRQQYEDMPFARGGQGALHYSKDNQHVLKLFTNLAPNRVAARVQQVDKIIGDYNVVGNDPYWNDLYSWPDKRATTPSLGVRMRRVDGLTRMDSYFYRVSSARLPADKRGWWLGRVASGVKLARAMWRLQQRGLCHSDLSEKNLMVDPFSGRLTILDCDSLVVPGVLAADVDGTPDYMAPEIVAGKATPTTQTDLHALAVLLYRWLLYRHPLKGPKQHAAQADLDDLLMLGERALYIEHPVDHSNRPQKLQFTADDVLTPRMADLFRQAFVDGLHTPAKRPLPNRWEEALIELLDHLVPCPNGKCEFKFFVARDGRPLQCPICKSYADFPDRLPFVKLQSPRQLHGKLTFANEGQYPRYVVGWPERPLYGWHADTTLKSSPDGSGKPPDTRPVALLRFDAAQREWYVENLALPQLQLGIGSGTQVQWQPVAVGSRAPLKHGTELLLGASDHARKAFVELRRVR
ncbi:MAG TPA: hypothetical protein VFU88_21335 [Ktedonobacterales bacterium]|nr:hypothetical protein [Ktedonobacterales bacterium]